MGQATSGTDRSASPCAAATAAVRTTQSCPCPLRTSQPSATRSRRPETAPTPVSSSVTSRSTLAISRLARVTCWYSARPRSASSGARSAS